MLLIIQNVDKGLTFAVSWDLRIVTPGVLNYKGTSSDQVAKWLAEKARAASGPGDFLDLIGAGWHLVDGFVTEFQSELDLGDSTARPNSATPPPLQEPHQHPRT